MEERARDRVRELEIKRRENVKTPPQEECNIPSIPKVHAKFKV